MWQYKCSNCGTLAVMLPNKKEIKAGCLCKSPITVDLKVNCVGIATAQQKQQNGNSKG